MIGKNLKFFKKQLAGKVNFEISKTLKKALVSIFKIIIKTPDKKVSILLSPASASFDQFKSFEERGNIFKKLVRFYGKNIYKEKFNIYWRNIDKQIFFSFIVLFLLGLFFSFSSTSSLAGERLNKDYYFFFQNILHLFFCLYFQCLSFHSLKENF